MELDIAIKILALVALATFIILAIYALVSINSFSKFLYELNLSLKSVTKDISSIKTDVKKTLDDFAVVQSEAVKSLRDIRDIKVKSIESMGEIDKAVVEIKDTTSVIKGNTDKVFNIFKPFENLSGQLYSKVAPPLIELSNIISALSKSASVFTAVLGRKKDQ